MRRPFIIVSFCFLTFCGFSQKTLRELLPQKGKTVDSFVPRSWLKLHTAFGDFDKDGLKDAAIVIVDSVSEKIAADANRSIIILKGTKKGYVISEYCDSAFLCLGCGGVHGDPFESLYFDGNKLILKHIVGSSYQSELTIRFRFQDSEWVLIGETIKGCWLNSKYENQRKFGGLSLYDMNYLTGGYVVKESNEITGKIEKDKKIKLPKGALIKVKDYNITSIWNIRT